MIKVEGVPDSTLSQSERLYEFRINTSQVVFLHLEILPYFVTIIFGPITAKDIKCYYSYIPGQKQYWDSQKMSKIIYKICTFIKAHQKQIKSSKKFKLTFFFFSFASGCFS
jgi:hypothetical protein